MKQSQWTFALFVLAALVFIATFAMNYLGGGRPPIREVEKPKAVRYVRFFWKAAGPIEMEEKKLGEQDFWFANDNQESVKVGLERTSCKCTSVHLFLLPESYRPFLIAEAVALAGIAPLGRMSVWSTEAIAMQMLRSMEPDGHELLKDKESVDVPAGAAGWVRMRWKGEKPGKQLVTATLWMDAKGAGEPTVLQTALQFHDPLRVKQSLMELGVIREEELEKGVTYYITCWSSTRPSLQLAAKAAGVRENPDADPFQVGKPVPLSPSEIADLEKGNNSSQSGNTDGMDGPVLCAYRVPITLRAMSPKGNIPFDIGPFARAVILSIPDMGGEPKRVLVRGRVVGVVEIGTDEEGGNINLRSFRTKEGIKVPVNLHSDVKGLTLQFDPERTSKFLKATLSAPKPERDGRQSWEMQLEVKPGQAFGIFPRRDHPLFEDCAVYLKARIPGKERARTIRIAVYGTATAER